MTGAGGFASPQQHRMFGASLVPFAVDRAVLQDSSSQTAPLPRKPMPLDTPGGVRYNCAAMLAKQNADALSDRLPSDLFFTQPRRVAGGSQLHRRDVHHCHRRRAPRPPPQVCKKPPPPPALGTILINK